ncbi:hypothetical protein [Streptomyces sp. YIM 130001]|nr:hypothetical protein [Streptomyces sp. YIM 130001]
MNPDMDQELTPLVENESNEGGDIAVRARTNGVRFGLPEAPL